MTPAEQKSRFAGKVGWPAAAALVAATLLAYLPALRGGFVWNDADYVTKPALRSFAGLGRIWFRLGSTEQYYPVLHSAFWLEHRLWGDAPIGYHLANVLLHAAAACLFAVVLRRLGLGVPAAWIGAFFFALHPVCVESVAWIAEQKNTLSIVFYLLAALAYFRWRDRAFGDAAKPTPAGGAYALATGAFLLALGAKTTTATLPAALLVVLWWREGRLAWRRDVRPLLPWFVLGAAGGIFSGWVERTYVGARGADFALGPAERLLVASRAAWFYLGKLAWPADLIFIYPKWTLHPENLLAWVPAVALVAAFGALAWVARFRGRRGPLAAALLFVGALFPTLGFLNVFAFIFSYVADHFQYLACLSVLGSAAWLLGRMAERRAAAGYGAAAALCLVLGILTWRQTRMYGDVITFYRTTLERNPNSWMSHLNLGTQLVDAGRVDDGIAEIERGLSLKPDNALAEYDLATALLGAGRAAQAADHYRRALALEPGYVKAHYGLGLALARLDRPDEAVGEYREAVRLAPDYAQAHASLGQALLGAGRLEEAAAELTEAVRYDPAVASDQYNLGLALAQLGRLPEAADHFAFAARLQPNDPDAQVNLALALAGLGRMDEAAEHCREALRIDPGFAPARELLARLSAPASP